MFVSHKHWATRCSMCRVPVPTSSALCSRHHLSGLPSQFSTNSTSLRVVTHFDHKFFYAKSPVQPAHLVPSSLVFSNNFGTVLFFMLRKFHISSVLQFRRSYMIQDSSFHLWSRYSPSLEPSHCRFHCFKCPGYVDV